jgi:Do/DeqQ family serine protease
MSKPIRTIVLLLLSFSFVGGVFVSERMRKAEQADAAQQKPAPPGAQRPVATGMPGGLPDLTAVAQRGIESVTNISSTQVVRTPNSPFANDPLFRYFFGDQEDPFGYGEQRAMSLGSGVVVSSDGFLLTNKHVVGDARAEVSVILPDKREMRAKIVGVDDWTDIAVLKVNATGLPTLPWGDSSKLKVAEWVLAIGNPYQLNQTVTLGIVSATGRSLEGRLATYEDFIQTDAAINPGNSGGALINGRGELVGINTAIFSESGGYQGIGFAVPSNLARHVMNDLVKYGSVRRGTITGIRLQQMTTGVAERLGAPNTRGVLIYSIDTRSDAYASGLRPGDIIVTFDGTSVDDASHFLRLLSDARIGGTVTLTVLRNGRQLTVKVPVVQAQGQRPGRR